MSQIHEVEETIAALAVLLTSYGPDNGDVHRVAKAVEPIATWHQEYVRWQEKSPQPENSPLLVEQTPKQDMATLKEKYRKLLAEKQ